MPESVLVLSAELFPGDRLLPKFTSVAGRPELGRVRVDALDPEGELFRGLAAGDACRAARQLLVARAGLASERSDVLDVRPGAGGGREVVDRFVSKKLRLATHALEAYVNVSLRRAPHVLVPDFIVLHGAVACMAFVHRHGSQDGEYLARQPGALRGLRARFDADMREAVAGMLARGFLYDDWKPANVSYDAVRGFCVLDFGVMLLAGDRPPRERTLEVQMQRVYAGANMHKLMAALQ